MKKIIGLMLIVLLMATIVSAEIVLVDRADLGVTEKELAEDYQGTVERLVPDDSGGRGFLGGVPWATGVTLLITILGWLGFGTYWSKFKRLVVEIKELLQTIHDALKDDKITEAELRQIIKEAKDVLQVFTFSRQELISEVKRNR